MAERKVSIQHVGFQMEEKPVVIKEEEGEYGGGGGEREEDPKMSERKALNGTTKNGEAADEFCDQLPSFKVRQSRFSTTSAPMYHTSPSFMSSRPSFGGLSSRLSFGGLSSRPSMVSLKSTISRVNSELYPERGSFMAYSLGQSIADMPPLARKMYIITQVLAAVSVSIGSMAVGFSAAYTSPALASLDDIGPFNVTAEQKSWVGSLMPLSALTGSIIGGYIIDALGRKMVILICGPPFIAAWLLIGSAVNIGMIYAGRVIGGLCVGLLTLTLPVYLSETIQPEIRGVLGLLPTTVGNLGILVCYLVGSYANWWVLAYVGAIVPILFTFMMCFVPETPRWYISKDRVDDARSSLQWLRGSTSDAEFELEAIQINFEASSQVRASILDVFNRRNIRAFLLSTGLMLFQQLSGINAVIFYTVSIFEMSGSTISGHVSTIIVGVVNLLATFVANTLIDKLGRKILLYISSALMVVSLLALGTFFHLKEQIESSPLVDSGVGNTTVEGFGNSTLGDSGAEDSDRQLIIKLAWLPLLSFMVYVVAFSLGWGPIPWLFMGEALPAKVRGPAASMVTALNWSCTFIVTKTFPGLLASLGASKVFFLFSAIMILGSIYAVVFVPETKGKTLEDIEEELSGRKKLRNRKISTISGLQM